MNDRDVQFAGEDSAGLASLVADLFLNSGGQQFGLDGERFAAILEEVRAKYLPADAASGAVQALYLSLRVEDLALARACAAGNERAWERFLTRYREKLYDVAGYITKESSSARELADSLYADLYGMSAREGQRVSKLASYTGRGSLEGWLRTVMAQEHVNRYRKQRRLVSLDEESEEGVQYAAAEAEPLVVAEPRLEAAMDEALGALSGEDRFVLASYYLDDRTLADIARTLSVHESTISRKVDRLAKSLRRHILAALGRSGMSRRQAQEALEVDVRDLGLNIRSRLTQETAPGTFPKKKKSGAPADDEGG
jgi:RNA polymerase sigma-70 factor (ECF subfamily)